MKFSLKKIKILFVVLTVFFVSLLFFGVQNILAASYGNYGLDTTVTGNVSDALSKTAVDSSASAGSFLSLKSGQLVGAVLAFICVIFLILIIFAGFTWMTSSGNEQKVDKAKNLITSSIIGLVIILAAYAITAFIGQQLTGSTINSTNNVTGGGSGTSITNQ